MDDLGQLILFFICAAIFGMGVSFLFGELKAAGFFREDELGTKAFWTEIEASEYIKQEGKL